MFTKSEVLELSPSEESKPVSLNPVCKSVSLLLSLLLKLNLSKCTTNNYPKLFPVTMSDSTLKVSLLKISEEDSLLPTTKKTLPEKSKPSKLKLSS